MPSNKKTKQAKNYKNGWSQVGPTHLPKKFQTPPDTTRYSVDQDSLCHET